MVVKICEAIQSASPVDAHVAPLPWEARLSLWFRFHPMKTLRVIDNLHPTIFRAVPTMLTMMIAHPRLAEFNLRSVRHWVVGGAPVPGWAGGEIQQVSGANVVEGYGLTESTSGVVLNSLYDKTHKGMGFPAIMMDTRVINPETGEDLPFGTDGRNCCW